MKMLRVAVLTAALFGLAACGEYTPSTDSRQSADQQRILQEGVSSVGLPNIVNFTQMRLVKDILEMNDQASLITYSYTFSEMTGRYVFFCNSIGYGVPYAAQLTNPQRIARESSYGIATLPQAEPDGVFRPESAEGTWIMCVDPQQRVARPVYSEPRLIVSPFPLTADTPAGVSVPVVIPTNGEAAPAPTTPQE